MLSGGIMPKHIAGETLYTIPELQELLGLSDRTLRQYFREGQLKGRKIGKSWHITEQALQQYLRGTVEEEADHEQ